MFKARAALALSFGTLRAGWQEEAVCGSLWWGVAFPMSQLSFLCEITYPSVGFGI